MFVQGFSSVSSDICNIGFNKYIYRERGFVFCPHEKRILGPNAHCRNLIYGTRDWDK
jgi:hypothetical protein